MCGLGWVLREDVPEGKKKLRTQILHIITPFLSEGVHQKRQIHFSSKKLTFRLVNSSQLFLSDNIKCILVLTHENYTEIKIGKH